MNNSPSEGELECKYVIRVHLKMDHFLSRCYHSEVCQPQASDWSTHTVLPLTSSF